MRETILAIPEQFRWYEKIKADLQFKKPRRIFYCGMGGSALAADILNDLWGEVEDNVEIIRDYHVPTYVGLDDLVIVASFSGNTEETLSCLKEAHQARAQLVVLANGGQAEQYAAENYLYFIKIPDCPQPRLATGYFFSALMYILQRAGYNIRFSPLAIADLLQESSVQLEARAQEVVRLVGDRVPIFYSTTNYTSVVRINKIKVNENAKTQSLANVLPELNHNEMVGWTNLRINPFFIFLVDAEVSERQRRRFEVLEELWDERSLPYTNLGLDGSNHLEKIWYGLYFGDFFSYYLALAQNIDPMPVAMVEEFKKRL